MPASGAPMTDLCRWTSPERDRQLRGERRVGFGSQCVRFVLRIPEGDEGARRHNLAAQSRRMLHRSRSGLPACRATMRERRQLGRGRLNRSAPGHFKRLAGLELEGPRRQRHREVRQEQQGQRPQQPSASIHGPRLPSFLHPHNRASWSKLKRAVRTLSGAPQATLSGSGEAPGAVAFLRRPVDPVGCSMR